MVQKILNEGRREGKLGAAFFFCAANSLIMYTVYAKGKGTAEAALVPE